MLKFFSLFLFFILMYHNWAAALHTNETVIVTFNKGQENLIHSFWLALEVILRDL